MDIENSPPARGHLVAIGASQGGLSALVEIVKALPVGFEAPVCVVLHVGDRPSLLPEILSSKGALPAFHPKDGELLRPGEIFVAPPGRHMLVAGDVIELRRTGKQHFTRPAIDPLFTSVARSYGRKAIGVILTGMLDDGADGMAVIKQQGGLCIIQDPDEADAPSMPLNALRRVTADYCLRLSEIAMLLPTLVNARVDRPS